MANTESAKKRIRQTLKRTAVNKGRMNKLRTFVRKVEDSIKENNKEAATKAFQVAQSVIASTAQKGTLHKNTARRKISRFPEQVRGVWN
jgi:small subunit ribosomal protein S20